MRKTPWFIYPIIEIALICVFLIASCDSKHPKRKMVIRYKVEQNTVKDQEPEKPVLRKIYNGFEFSLYDLEYRGRNYIIVNGVESIAIQLIPLDNEEPELEVEAKPDIR